MLRNLGKISVLMLSLFFINSFQVAYADNYIPLMPRFYGQANFGPVGSGEADLLLSFYGNPHHIVYLNGYSKVHDKNEWVGSLGIGYRLIWNDDLIYGAYLFGDQNKVEPSHYFVINPGIEFMTNCWDGHLNAYVVTNDRDDIISRGNQELLLSDNSLFLLTFDERQEAANGVDAVIGYTLPTTNRLRIFGGGYLFDYQHSSTVKGVVGGVEIPVATPQFTIGVEDSYDNINKNTAVITLRLTLGGVPKTEIHMIQDRMTDPVERHFATLESGAGIPTSVRKINERVTLLSGNIFSGIPFFVPFGVNFPNCTFQHPCNNVPIFNDVGGNICFINGVFVPCGEGNIVPF